MKSYKDFGALILKASGLGLFLAILSWLGQKQPFLVGFILGFGIYVIAVITDFVSSIVDEKYVTPYNKKIAKTLFLPNPPRNYMGLVILAQVALSLIVMTIMLLPFSYLLKTEKIITMFSFIACQCVKNGLLIARTQKAFDNLFK